MFEDRESKETMFEDRESKGTMFEDRESKGTMFENGESKGTIFEDGESKGNIFEDTKQRKTIVEDRKSKDAIFEDRMNNAIDNTLKFYNEHHRNRRSTPGPGFSTVVVSGNESGVQLNSLDPYINYTIVIQAATVKGTGPLSSPILVATAESGK